MKKLLYGIVCLMLLVSIEQGMNAKTRASQFKDKGGRRLLKRERRVLKDKKEQNVVAAVLRVLGNVGIEGVQFNITDEDSLEDYIDEMEVKLVGDSVNKEEFKKMSKKARKRRKRNRKEVERVGKYFDFNQKAFDRLIDGPSLNDID